MPGGAEHVVQRLDRDQSSPPPAGGRSRRCALPCSRISSSRSCAWLIANSASAAIWSRSAAVCGERVGQDVERVVQLVAAAGERRRGASPSSSAAARLASSADSPSRSRHGAAQRVLHDARARSRARAAGPRTAAARTASSRPGSAPWKTAPARRRPRRRGRRARPTWRSAAPRRPSCRAAAWARKLPAPIESISRIAVAMMVQPTVSDDARPADQDLRAGLAAG